MSAENKNDVIPLTLKLKKTLRTQANSEKLLVKKMHPDAVLPKRGSTFAAGYDLFALEDDYLPVGGKSHAVRTGIAIRIPQLASPLLTYAQIHPRSGLSYKCSLETGAGVIDADYSDEVKVIMHNFGALPYDIKRGDRIAQMVLHVHVSPDVAEVEELPEVKTSRCGGFGSTGL